jgi:predicted dehydrogenase
MRVKRVSWMGLAMVTMIAWTSIVAAQEKAPGGLPGKPREAPLDNRPMGSGPLGVVIAGMVHGHVDGFLAAVVKGRDIEIEGIAEPDRALFDAYAKKYGLDGKLYHADLEEMLKSTATQVVLVYTNTLDHRKVVETCARYRARLNPQMRSEPFEVMMEKPLAVSAEDAHAIAKAAKETGMTVLVNYFTTWEPSRHAAHEMAMDGTIGDVRKMVAHDGHGGPKEIGVGPEFLGWLTDPKLNGGGALYDFGCYGVDFMTWLMGGERPLTVTAVTLQIKPDVYPKVDDDATVILTYPKAVGIVQGSWNWPFGRSDVEIYGKTGQVKTLGRDAVEVRKAGEKQTEKMEAPALKPPENDELSYLRAALVGDVKPGGPGSLEVNLVVAEVLDAARESAKSGRTIKMGEVRK